MDKAAIESLEPNDDGIGEVGKGYTPTPREAEALARTKARMASRPKVPKFKIEQTGGVAQLKLVHEDETTAAAMQVNALGLGSYDEFSSLLKGVLNFTTRDGKIDDVAASEALQLVIGIGPENTLEAMLAVQMAAVHLATMDAARRLHRTPLSVESVACNSKVLNNLARTFSTQAEAFKKLRPGSPQRVVVEHKHYHLHQTPDATGDSGGVETETELNPHVRELPQREAMLGYLETVGGTLQGAGGNGLERVPLPRC